MEEKYICDYKLGILFGGDGIGIYHLSSMSLFELTEAKNKFVKMQNYEVTSFIRGYERDKITNTSIYKTNTLKYWIDEQ